VGDNPKLALITRADVVEACTWKPDESDAIKYPAFEAALDAALEDEKVRRDIKSHLLDALDDIAQRIEERIWRSTQRRIC
jgi:hypothetical protein